jgi:phosphotransferase system enzyme I (PtsI)
MTNLAKANSQPDDSRPAPMVCLYGQGAARGYAIGRALVMGAAALEVAHYRVPLASIEAEQHRLCRALETTRSEMLELAQTLPEDAPRELAALLNVHGMLLSDPLLADEALNLIHEKHYNAEWALTTQGQILGEQFAAMEDEYLRERGADVRHVIERVLHVLSGTRALSAFERIGETDEPLIVIAHDISPADMIRLRGGRFAGFATDLGGATSHTAIVARSMSVPAVVALGHARSLLRDGDMVIIDGVQGALIVNPSPLALAQYKVLQEQYLGDRMTLTALKDVPAETIDGISISLEANIELPDEVDLALAHGATGIGLFRSEFLFIGRTELPSEEEQYLAYSSVVKAMQNRPVTIRTLDIGADKALDGEATVATNPALGLRAIRYCLAHPELFATQLRAILRASAHGTVRILIPMVAHMHEVTAAKAAIESAKRELDASGQSYSDNIQIGCMVEIPATAIAIDPFADALDFLSIGTNDLIQYTLAIDRADNEVSALYDPLHPAVLKLIANTINAGMRAGIPVAGCGEMAGDPKLTRLLLGLGLTNFSMHPQQLLDVKREIRQGHSNALRQQVATALNRQSTIDPSVLE